MVADFFTKPLQGLLFESILKLYWARKRKIFGHHHRSVFGIANTLTMARPTAKVIQIVK